MGTDIQPPAVPEEPPAGGEGAAEAIPAAPPAAPVAPHPPAAGPAAPVVGGVTGGEPPQYDQQVIEQAMGLHRALNDPIGQGEAMTRLVQRHGQLPDWFTWDHAVDAMRNYAQFISEMGEADEDVTTQPQQPGMAPAAPQQDYERMLQQAVGPLQQELQALRQERMQDEGERRASVITSAVDSVAGDLDPAGRETLLNNVVYGLRSAMDQGAQIDFSPRAINEYASGMLTHLRSMALAERQEAIAQHREIAPETRTPNGAPTSAAVPRGLRGSATRALDMARQYEAGLPPS